MDLYIVDWKFSQQFEFRHYLIYYNFYFSESEIIAGGTYTVYPYGLQPAIPFMLGLFFSFITWLLYLGTEHGKIRIKVPFIRIRKGN